MTPEALQRRILFEESHLIVVDKPAGVPTSGRSLDDEDCVQFALMQREGRMVWAIHQLDADTTGVNVFATRRSVVPLYQRRMSYPNAVKRYLAICHGDPPWTRKRVTAPIGPLPSNPRTHGVHAGGKPAQTSFEVISRGDGAALMDVRITTGRTHQIRIHASHLGFPLIGEEWYRDPPCTRHPRQALHAWQIAFRDDAHPPRWTAPLADDLRALAAELSLAIPPDA